MGSQCTAQQARHSILLFRMLQAGMRGPQQSWYLYGVCIPSVMSVNRTPGSGRRPNWRSTSTWL